MKNILEVYIHLANDFSPDCFRFWNIVEKQSKNNKFTKSKLLSCQFSLTYISEYLLYARHSARQWEWVNGTVPALEKLSVYWERAIYERLILAAYAEYRRTHRTHLVNTWVLGKISVLLWCLNGNFLWFNKETILALLGRIIFRWSYLDESKYHMIAAEIHLRLTRFLIFTAFLISLFTHTKFVNYL